MARTSTSPAPIMAALTWSLPPDRHRGRYMIDMVRDTKPFWTVTLGMVFLVAGFYHLIKDSSR